MHVLCALCRNAILHPSVQIREQKDCLGGLTDVRGFVHDRQGSNSLQGSTVHAEVCVPKVKY